MLKASEPPTTTLVISYLTLRKALGVLGIALPFILAIGGLIVFKTGLQESISDYYHTGMRDVFVAILFAIGVFLYSYRGYDIRDNLAANLAGVLAIGIAFFPTTPDLNPSSLDRLVGIVHWVSSALFFITVAYISLFLFTLTHKDRLPTKQKIIRNYIYRACGYLILASIILIGVHAILPDTVKPALSAYKPVFWLESIAVVAFGFSWLTKGELIGLRDQA